MKLIKSMAFSMLFLTASAYSAPGPRMEKTELFETCFECTQNEARAKFQLLADEIATPQSNTSTKGYIYTGTGSNQGYQFLGISFGAENATIRSMTADVTAKNYFDNLHAYKNLLIEASHAATQKLNQMSGGVSDRWKNKTDPSEPPMMVTCTSDTASPFAYFRNGNRTDIESAVTVELATRMPVFRQLLENFADSVNISEAITDLIEWLDEDDMVQMTFNNGGRLYWRYGVTNGIPYTELDLDLSYLGHGFVNITRLGNVVPVGPHASVSTVVGRNRDGYFTLAGGIISEDDCISMDIEDFLNHNIQPTDVGIGGNWDAFCGATPYTDLSGGQYVTYNHTYWVLIARQGHAEYVERTITRTIYIHSGPGHDQWSMCN